MSVAAYHKPIVTPSLGTVTGTRRRISPVPKAPAQHTLHNKLFTADIFTISFNYVQQMVHMKVLKISYPNRRAIYKVVLSSSFCQTVRECWLEHQSPEWVTLLGYGLASDLKSAITTAISFQEFSAI